MTLREFKDTFSSNTEFELLWGEQFSPHYAPLKIISVVNDTKYLYLGRVVEGIEGIEDDLIVLSAEANSRNYVSVLICDTPACGDLCKKLDQENDRHNAQASNTCDQSRMGGEIEKRNRETVIISLAAIAISTISLLWSIARLLSSWRLPR
jgi:hypothetical protein